MCINQQFILNTILMLLFFTVDFLWNDKVKNDISFKVLFS